MHDDAREMARDPRGTEEDWEPFLVPWLGDLVPPPPDVAWPRHMTAIHPRAVGSLGREAEDWIFDNLKITLRWWQRLALRRQLEVDAEGNLVWLTIIESTPRRSGKSTRIRATALWRLHQAERFGEPQTVMLTGKDLPVIKEIHRRAWPWAEARGYAIRKQNGNEEIEMDDLSRWLIRSVFGVYGYDVGFGVVDEGWGVAPMAVDDGLEPALLERSNPQLLMTSTGHPKATALMTTRRDAALEQLAEPHDSLLLDWGAPAGSAVGDKRAWRLASPHWSPQREQLLDAALRRLLTGKDTDPEGLDPEISFAAQYLNVWPERKGGIVHWLPDELVQKASAPAVTLSGQLTGAIEISISGDQWSAAVSDGRSVSVCVGVSLPAAVAWMERHNPSEILAHVAVASRLPPTWSVRHVTTGEASAATMALADAVKAGEIVWDGGDKLAVQLARVVTAPGPAGPRVGDRVSRGSVEGVKAVAWAFWRAVTNPVEAPAVF